MYKTTAPWPNSQIIHTQGGGKRSDELKSLSGSFFLFFSIHSVLLLSKFPQCLMLLFEASFTALPRLLLSCACSPLNGTERDSLCLLPSPFPSLSFPSPLSLSLGLAPSPPACGRCHERWDCFLHTMLLFSVFAVLLRTTCPFLLPNRGYGGEKTCITCIE